MPTDAAGAQEQDATASIRKRFRQTLERFRFGLAIANGLCDRDRRVALFMLEFCNQEVFLQTGTLACWVGVETITLALLGKKARRPDGTVDRSYVQRAQRKLRQAGVITVHEAGGGRGLATTYVYSTVWLAGVTADALSWAPPPVCNRLGAAPPKSSDRTPMDQDYRGTSTADAEQASRAAVSDISCASAADFDVSSTRAPVSGAAVSGIRRITASVLGSCSGSSAQIHGVDAAVFGGSAAAAIRTLRVAGDVSTGNAALSGASAVAEATPDAEGIKSTAVANPAAGSAIAPPAGASRPPRLQFRRLKGNIPAPQRYSVKRVGLSALPVDKGQSANPRQPEIRGTIAVKSAASVQPESLDIKPDTWRPPFQQSLLLTLDGGKRDGVQSVASPRPTVQVPKLVGQGSANAPVNGRSLRDAVREQKDRARKVAEAESDPRFAQLRAQALRILGDSRLASLAIAVMDETTKKRILRGYWPAEPRLREVFEAAASTARGMLGLGVDATQVTAPPSSAPPGPPVRDRIAGSPMRDLQHTISSAATEPGAALSRTQEDRLERMARDAAEQAAAAVHGVQALQKDLQQITNLLQKLLTPDAGQQTAVA